MSGQAGIYALARGVPGAINLLSLALYTRLLEPASYGEYALIAAGVALLSTVGFYWLNLGLVRFYPNASNQEELLATILRAFFVTLLLLTALGAALAHLLNIRLGIVAAGALLLAAQAWHGLQLQLARSQLSPKKFAQISLVRAVLAPIAASILIAANLGAIGLLLGLALAALVSALKGARSTWSRALQERPSAAVSEALIRYGGPLTAVFALRFVVNSSDKFMIAHFLGKKEAGAYSAATELAGNSIGFLSNVIQLAALPLIISAFEKGGTRAASAPYKENISLLVTLLFPATAGFALLSSQISYAFFPPDFSTITSPLLPWIAAGTMVSMLKSAGFDVAFHLSKRTRHQLLVVLLSATLNVTLNQFMIPKFGVLGAAQSTLITHLFALLLSLLVGRKLVRLPFPVADLFRTLGATAIMIAALIPTLGWQGLHLLLVQIAIGFCTFTIAGLLVGLRPIRDTLSRRLFPHKEVGR